MNLDGKIISTTTGLVPKRQDHRSKAVRIPNDSVVDQLARSRSKNRWLNPKSSSFCIRAVVSERRILHADVGLTKKASKAMTVC